MDALPVGNLNHNPFKNCIIDYFCNGK